MLGDHARKIVLDELKEEQMSTSTMIVMCISASLTSIISWFTLFIAKIEGSMDFYPFYKLINGSVLVLINFVESSAKTFDLSMGELMMLFPLSFIPAIAVIIGYYKAKKEHSYLKTAKK